MIKKIFLAPMSHCDSGYTDFASEVKRKHAQYLKEVILLCEETKSNPEGLKFKWTCEEAWTVKEFLNKATKEEKRKFFYFVKNGQIEIAGFFGGLLSELPSYEELIRSCEYSVSLAKKNKFSISTVILDDIPGITPALPQVLSGYGISYFLFGPNTYRSIVGWSQLPRLFYLQSKGGGEVLLWHIGQDRRIPPAEFKGMGSEYSFGDMYVISPYREMKGISDKGNISFAERGKLKEKGREALDNLLGRLKSENYPYDAILLQCAADNRGPDKEIISTIKSLNKNFSEFSFILATPAEFFQYMEEKYKRIIPIYSGALIDAWSDGAGTMSKTTALYRECQREVAVLEKSLALSKKFDKKYLNKLKGIYENLLYYAEHTFGYSGWRGLPDKTFIQSWKDKSAYIEKAKRLIGEKELLEKKTPPKIISLKKSARDISSGENFIENCYYRIKFSEAGIKSIYDKELKKELIDKKSSFVFNGLIFTEIKGLPTKPPVKGSGISDRIKAIPFASFDYKNPWVEKKNQSVEFSNEFKLKKAPVKISGKSKIILYSGLKRIDFINTIYKEENREKEALYFAFPFNLKDDFKTYIEMAYNLLEFPDDLLPGSHSDFIAIQNFVTFADKDITLTWVTLDAPLVELGDIQTFKWAGSTYQPKRPTIFSYIMNCSIFK